MEALDQAGWLQQLNWVDFVLGLALIATLLVGFGLGFYRQMALATGLLMGLVLAGQLTDRVAAVESLGSIRESIGDGGTRMSVYFAFLILPVVLSILSFFVFPKIFSKTLKALDSVLGGALGLMSAVTLFWVFVLGSSQIEESWLEEPVRESYLGSRLAEGAVSLSQIFPEDFRARVENGFRRQLDPILDAAPAEEVEPKRG